MTRRRRRNTLPPYDWSQWLIPIFIGCVVALVLL